MVLSGSTSAIAEGQTPIDGIKVAERVFSSPDPKAAYTALPPAEREAFTAATAVAKVETEVVGTGLAGNEGKRVNSLKEALEADGCWYVSFRGAGKGLTGNTLYSYWQHTAICVSNGRVYHVWVDNVGGETSTPGWRIDKDPISWTANPGWEGRGVAQYYFVLGAGPWDIAHPTTCLQGRVNADGVHWLPSNSCNIGD